MWQLLITLLLVWRLLFGPGGLWGPKDDASRASREAEAALKDAGPRTFDKPPGDPWMPWSAAARGTGVAHCGPWVRDDAPQYASIQVNVDHRGCNIVGDAANEPTIAIDPTNTNRVVIGWRQFDTIESDFRQAGYGYSHDGGHTWIFPGVLAPGVFRSDPVLDAAPDGTIYHIGCGFRAFETVFRSWDGGMTWDGTVESGIGDKPWITIDKSDGIGRGNIYISPGGLLLSRSTDGGASFDDLHHLRSLPIYPTMSVGTDGTLHVGGQLQA